MTRTRDVHMSKETKTHAYTEHDREVYRAMTRTRDVHMSKETKTHAYIEHNREVCRAMKRYNESLSRLKHLKK